MPESKKMAKNREQAANRAAGLGDEQGRLPSRVKAAEVIANCTQCMLPIRMTKTNTEAKQHAESKHSTFPFATCFPRQFDPTVVVVATTPSAAVAAAPVAKKALKKADDLSFLDAALLRNGKKK